MDQNLIYAKTPLGEEAMTQRTRVVQRSQRMVLVVVDGKTCVEELIAKIGDAKLVETALQELESGGFVALVGGNPNAKSVASTGRPLSTPSQLSQFSTFGPKATGAGIPETVMPSNFSTFGRPVSRQTLTSPPKPKAPVVEVVEKEPEVELEPFVEPGRRLGVGTLIGGGLALVVVGALAGVLLYPYDSHIGEWETALSAQMGSPVKIGAAGPRLLPSPALELRNLRMGEGEGGGVQLDTLSLPGIGSMFGVPAEKLSVVELKGGSLTAGELAAWVSHSAGPMAPEVLRVHGLKLRVGNQVLAEFQGVVNRKPDGSLQNVSLTTSERDVKLELEPQGKDLAVQVNASSWKPYSNFPFPIDYLEGKGLLRADKLVLNSLDLRFLGGRYEGEWLVDWSRSLVMAGAGNLVRLDANQLAKVLAPQLNFSGELSGTWRFRTEGDSATVLWDKLEGDGNLRLERGEFRAVDLSEAVRQGRGQVVRSGNTRFERLSGNAHLGARGLELSGLHMDAGLMTAEGRIDASRAGEVVGKLVVSLSRGGSGSASTLNLQGRLPNLEVVVQ